MAKSKKSENTIAKNRKAYHDYTVLDTIEAGIELVGTEVKSIRAGHVNLKEAWIDIQDGEAFIVGMHVSPYEQGSIFNLPPTRKRKLLMHKQEITRLAAQIKKEGQTLIPLALYYKGSRVKVSVGVCKGKKLYDKRRDMAKRDAKRDMDRAMKERYK